MRPVSSLKPQESGDDCLLTKGAANGLSAFGLFG